MFSMGKSRAFCKVAWQEPHKPGDPSSVLTDIDAIGARGRRLLILDGKSKSFDTGYESGDASYFTKTTTTEAEVRHLQRIVETIKANGMKGPNWDFSEYSEVDAAVVYPWMPFLVEGGSGIRHKKGLPWLIDIEDLRKWLQA